MKKITGISLNYLVATALIVSGTLKLIGLEAYQNMIMELSPHYFENIYLLGTVAILSGALLAIPKTFTLGCLASLVFFGGTIAAHMQHGDNYLPQLVFVVLTILMAYLKRPDWFDARKN